VSKNAEEIRAAVRDRYASAALSVSSSCCNADEQVGSGFGAELYAIDQTGQLPEAAVLASLGCGNPTALAALQAGQVVLDLGSGGGIDVLLSARRVGPSGKVYGLDMTPEMIELARRNQGEAGVENAEFLLGTIEHIPLPDASVDVIISNCVINLAADKDAVLREAFRVLKSGGLFAVSDVVLQRALPEEMRGLMALWTGCIAGALTTQEYYDKLASAGFIDAEITPTLVHDRESVVRLSSSITLPEGLDADSVIDAFDGAVSNAFIRARRPL
jgi:SAM-dependent methyltransferase